MAEGSVIVLSCAVLGSIVTIVVVWLFASSWRSKAALARDSAYKTLTEHAVATLADLQTQIDRTTGHLKSIDDRLGAIEKALTVID